MLWGSSPGSAWVGGVRQRGWKEVTSFSGGPLRLERSLLQHGTQHALKRSSREGNSGRQVSHSINFRDKLENALACMLASLGGSQSR